MNQIKWLVFDLGGVLAEYVGTVRLISWMRNPAKAEELYRQWLFSPTVRAFESGKIDFSSFADAIIHELDLTVAKDELMAAFPDFVTDYFPGARELITTLAGRYPLAILSNTNAPQWEKLCGKSHLHTQIQRLFISYQTGYLKPDPDVFRFLITELGCPADQIVFFDDNSHNVQGAEAQGIRAIQVKGFEDMREIISQMGL